jgi:hypothetical protein
MGRRGVIKNNNQASLFIVLTLALSSLVGLSPASASTSGVDTSKIVVLSSENISVDNSTNVLKVFLNTFKPNSQINFEFQLNNQDTVTLMDGAQKLISEPHGRLQFSYNTGNFLTPSDLGVPFKEFKNALGSPLLQFFSVPSDFPRISLTGNTSLISKREILTTPVVSNGSYAISSIGSNIKYFYKSTNNIIGFRKLTDAPAAPSLGGTPTYGFLEQSRYDVTATSPGNWRILDQNYQFIQRINSVKTKFGTVLPEGHGMTVSPAGNAILIMTVTRSVDSSWLKRPYTLPILDCDIAEVVNGKAISEFSFWDWAVANKSVSQPLLDGMRLFNDPQNPTSSPVDICHANSLQYSKERKQYLISLRSPSILMLLSSDLHTVKAVIPTNSALQHFARFKSANEITALGNYTFGSHSDFLDFKLTNGKWVLTSIPFPVHVPFCGNTQYIDATHIWLGGGCGPFIPGTIGAIFTLANGTLTQLGSVKMQNLVYTYRADLL